MEWIRQFVINIDENKDDLFENIDNTVYYFPLQHAGKLSDILDAVFTCKDEYKNHLFLNTLQGNCGPVIQNLDIIIDEILKDQTFEYNYDIRHQSIFHFLFFWLYICYLRRNYMSNGSIFGNIKRSIRDQCENIRMGTNGSNILLLPLKNDKDLKRNFLKIYVNSQYLDANKLFLVNNNKDDKLHVDLINIFKEIINKIKTEIYGTKMLDKDIVYYEDLRDNFNKIKENIEKSKEKIISTFGRLNICKLRNSKGLTDFIKGYRPDDFRMMPLDAIIRGYYSGGPQKLVDFLEKETGYKSIEDRIEKYKDKMLSKDVPIKEIFEGLKKDYREFEEIYKKTRLDNSIQQYEFFLKAGCENETPESKFTGSLYGNQMVMMQSLLPFAMISSLMQSISGGISPAQLNGITRGMGLNTQFTEEGLRELKEQLKDERVAKNSLEQELRETQAELKQQRQATFAATEAAGKTKKELEQQRQATFAASEAAGKTREALRDEKEKAKLAAEKQSRAEKLAAEAREVARLATEKAAETERSAAKAQEEARLAAEKATETARLAAEEISKEETAARLEAQKKAAEEKAKAARLAAQRDAAQREAEAARLAAQREAEAARLADEARAKREEDKLRISQAEAAARVKKNEDKIRKLGDLKSRNEISLFKPNSQYSGVEMYVPAVWDASKVTFYGEEYLTDGSFYALLYDEKKDTIAFCGLNFESELYFNTPMEIYHINKILYENDYYIIDFNGIGMKLIYLNNGGQKYLLNSFDRSENDISGSKKSDIIDNIKSKTIDIFVQHNI